MDYIPCPKRRFPYRINFLTLYTSYLRWLRHLMERLGEQNTLLLWKETFADYDDQVLLSILSSGWHEVETDEIHPIEATAEAWINEFLSSSGFELSNAEVRNIIENTPPITQIKQLFSSKTVEKEISAFDALHIRFDGCACLAEALIDKYGKQGELIVYDLMTEGRLASSKGETGSVEAFIESFTSDSDTPNLFTAGLEKKIEITIAIITQARIFLNNSLSICTATMAPIIAPGRVHKDNKKLYLNWCNFCCLKEMIAKIF